MTDSREERPWTWSEVASWIDTEGHVRGGFRRNGRKFCHVDVAQKEREVLDSLCGFIRAATGKYCGVYYSKKAGAYYARWSSKEAIAITIEQTEQFIRTKRKREQYAAAKLILPLIMTEREQRVLAAAGGREAKRMKRLLRKAQMGLVNGSSQT